jgi:hypothetical protein
MHNTSHDNKPLQAVQLVGVFLILFRFIFRCFRRRRVSHDIIYQSKRATTKTALKQPETAGSSEQQQAAHSSRNPTKASEHVATDNQSKQGNSRNNATIQNRRDSTRGNQGPISRYPPIVNPPPAPGILCIFRLYIHCIFHA